MTIFGFLAVDSARSDKINARRSLRTLPKKLEQIAAVKYCRRPLTGEALPE